MHNRTDISSGSVREKLLGTLRGNRVLLELLGSAAAGFVMANSFLFGGVAPFGVALSAALPGRHSQCAALGALLGYVVTSQPLGNMKYIIALLLVAVVKWVLESKLARASTPMNNVMTALGALAASSVVILVSMDATLYDILLTVAEIALASGSAYFFNRTLSVAETGLSGASRTDVSCVIVSFAVLLMGFSGFRIGSLSLGRIMAVIAILLCARYGGEAAGAISGITAGIAIGLAGKDFTYVVSAYAFGGLIAGVFGRGGRVAVAGAFVIVNTLTALFVSESMDLYTAVFEIFAASAIFMAIPPAWVKRLQAAAARSGPPDGTTQALLRGKLTDVSQVLREIGDTTRQVSARLSRMESASLTGLQVRVAEKVCKHCGNRTACWQFHYAETAAAMGECTDRLRKDGSINRENTPKFLSRTCCRLDMLLTEINGTFRDHVAKEGVQRKVSQVRSVMTDQFDGMAQMLEEVSGELCTIRQVEPQKSSRVRDYLQKESFQCNQLLCYCDEFDRLKLELRIPAYQLARLDKAKATLELSSLLEAELDLPTVEVREKDAALIFHEKAAFTLDMGAYQIASEGQKLCGDAYSWIREQGGKAHLILSDGMGSGGSAAVDSSMASSLLNKLLSVGVGHEAALKLVNSALLVKSGEESLATIDICTLDLFTGKAEFYKAGAAPSYVLRGGRVGNVDSTSLPAGILRGVAFEKSAVSLRAGDTVVMISDGVIATGTDWVTSELERLGASGDNQKLCEKLAMTAKLRREDGREDDITVMAATLRKGI